VRALCLAKLGRYDEAIPAYEAAFEVGDHPHTRADFGDLLDKAGRDRESLEQYQRAQEGDPHLAVGWCGEAVLRWNSSDPEIASKERAVELMRRALELEPENPEYLELMRTYEAGAVASER